jgi:L-fuculose-phosphate aldolase
MIPRGTMNEERRLREEMVRVGARLVELGLLGAAEGNLSCRLGSDRLLCTPSGVSKGFLDPLDLVVIDLFGNPVDGKRASSEIRLHLAFYDADPNVQAVVHAHPITATAFASSPAAFPDEAFPEAIVVLGKVVKASFATPGTPALPDSIRPYLPSGRSFLLGNHGAVVSGTSLEDALFRMETLERVAQIGFRAHALGGLMPLSPEAVGELQELGRRMMEREDS